MSNNAPVWLESYEVKREGTYILHRIDDVPLNAYDGCTSFLLVSVSLGTNHVGNLVYYVNDKSGYKQEIESMDSECRFLGPIPNLPTED